MMCQFLIVCLVFFYITKWHLPFLDSFQSFHSLHLKYEFFNIKFSILFICCSNYFIKKSDSIAILFRLLTLVTRKFTLAFYAIIIIVNLITFPVVLLFMRFSIVFKLHRGVEMLQADVSINPSKDCFI